MNCERCRSADTRQATLYRQCLTCGHEWVPRDSWIFAPVTLIDTVTEPVRVTLGATGDPENCLGGGA